MTIQAYMEENLARAHAEGCFPSAAWAVGVKDEVLGRAFIGGAPLPEDKPVDEHTRYDMASISKVIGPTMVALRALQDGTLALTDTLGDFFPDCPQDKRSITVQQLMTHTAGFYPDFRMDLMLQSPEEALHCLLTHPLMLAPGAQTAYSCMGYITFGKALERRFGKPLRQLVQERVFDPLHLTEARYSPVTDAPCAATEVDAATGKPWIGVVHDENARFLGGNSGNAGVFMNLRDGIRFVQMLAGGGRDYLTPETMALALHNYTPNQKEHRGLGFQLAGSPDCFFSSRVPADCFGHTGFTGTSFVVEPCTGFWVLLLTNRVYPTRENSGLFAFRRRTHGDLWEMFEALN